MKLATVIVGVLALTAVAFACDTFDTVQDCKAFDAAPVLDEVCTIDPENPHFLWFKGWVQPGYMDEDLVVDTTGNNPGFGRFLRDAAGNTHITAALCSRVNCADIKFNLQLDLTGLQQPPLLDDGWNGNYPVSGGGVPGFPAAPGTPKRELKLNTDVFPTATGDCKCLHNADCPAEQPVPSASDCWEFYTAFNLDQVHGLVTGLPGTLTQDIEIEFTLYRTTGTHDYLLSPQRGFGANDKNQHDGFGMWFNWKVNNPGTSSQYDLPTTTGWGSGYNFDSGIHGDVNLELNCNSQVTIVCVDLVDGFECDRAHLDETGPCIEVVTSTSTFRATGDHLIQTPRGWQLVRELRVGDVLRSGIIESVRDTICKSLNSCITDNQRFDAYGEVFAQNGLITPDNYKEMLIE